MKFSIKDYETFSEMFGGYDILRQYVVGEDFAGWIVISEFSVEGFLVILTRCKGLWKWESLCKLFLGKTWNQITRTF